MTPQGSRSVAAKKAALRARMRELRDEVPEADRARLAESLEKRLRRLDVFDRPATVLLFSSFGSEMPTQKMRETLARDGHRILLPFLHQGEIEAAKVLQGEDLLPTAYGPEEPATREAVDVQEIDVVVLPGLAFDREGYRLGYGGGHYDRFLARPGLTALRIGVGYHFQVVERVPRGRNDRRVDVVVTDREAIVCRTRA